MNSNPTFSVIIPTYNRAYILECALNSVLAQTYSNYDIIIVDDGSTDGTPDLIQRYISEGGGRGGRIRYVRQEQQGKSVALNTAVKLATGEWIAFLDSDDVWLPDKLEWQVRAIEQFGDKCDACFTDARYTNNPCLQTTAFRRAGKQHKELLGMISEPLRFVIDEPHGIHEQTLVVRGNRLREMDGFDPRIRVLEDHDFVFRLAHHVAHFCFVNIPLVDIDRTPNRSIGLIDLFAKDEIRLQDQQYIYEKWLRIEGLKDNIRSKIHEYLSAVYSGWANCFLADQDYEKAAQAMATALHHKFAAKLGLKWMMTRTIPELTRKLLLRREVHASQILN